MSLANSNVAVAGVVFIASILVPFTKVIVMFTLLLSIHFKFEQGLRTRILLLRFVTWIGRWSMLDLFVISLTMSLIIATSYLLLPWDRLRFISAQR
jgi:paraquat-inducible protein A